MGIKGNELGTLTLPRKEPVRIEEAQTCEHCVMELTGTRPSVSKGNSLFRTADDIVNPENQLPLCPDWLRVSDFPS